MNEVFAHAALIKHKHVVRYYNSWVEKGQVSHVFIISVADPDPGSGAFLTPGWVKTQDPRAFKQFWGL